MNGSIILQQMKDRGVTKTELAKKAGLARAHLTMILNGQTRTSFDTAAKLAALLDIDLRDLADRENSAPESAQPWRRRWEAALSVKSEEELEKLYKALTAISEYADEISQALK